MDELHANASRNPEGRVPNWIPVAEDPLFQPRKLKVVCIGAGFSGLMISYEYQHGKTAMNQFVDLTIYEKNSDIGGTWFENRYPGVACDVPAHIYTFPFEPNPSWSRFYASGSEILDYIKRTTEKYNLDRPIQLNSRVVSSIWDQELGKWRLKIQQGASETLIEDEADVLINSTGFLNRWGWPDIKGLASFRGRLLHSASWDSQLDWTGKRIGIIGNGSSAVQILPEMQPTATSVVNFVRSPLWISNNFASEFTPEGNNFEYSEEAKQKFREQPEQLTKLRQEIEHAFNKFFYVLLKDSPQQAGAYEAFRGKMAEQLNNDPFLCSALIPTFQVGCRRLSPGDNYLSALQKANVSLELSSIVEAVPEGIKTQDQKIHELDILICATGFDVSFCPGWDIRGKAGLELKRQWSDHPEAYFGVWAENMPNYMTINGPNTPVAHGSLLSVMYWTVEYIAKWCRKIATQDIRSVLVQKQALDDYNVYTQELIQRTVWTGDCRSWFKNGKADGRVVAMYGGSVIHFKEVLEEFRTEDFDYEYNSRNRFKFMGNGITRREVRGDDLAYYVEK